jgi:hypothetical protein
MKSFSFYKKAFLAIALICSSVFIFTTCMNEAPLEPAIVQNYKGEQFAGSASCMQCHQEIAKSHLETAHYLTSREAAPNYFKGSFDPGKNSFDYNADQKVSLEIRDKDFYQVEYVHGEEKTGRRMDIIVGSGAMGQSFLSWKNNQLFQLPVTYFSAAHEWSNSPGYPNKPVFNRQITSRCLECHMTYADIISPPGEEPEKFDRRKMIYGVDCEKCHGPAAKHVDFQVQNPATLTAKYIVNPAKLSRQQNLDLCASCHGGRLQKTRPSFEFQVGDTLSNFYKPDTTVPDPNKIDVHGNQYGLLRASKCFKNSETLTCNSCHGAHQNERGQIATFSQRCMTCHNSEHDNFCKLASTIGASIKTNCIDCHMPVKPSRAIAVFLPGEKAPTAALIRSHFVSIYPEETKKLKEFIQKK